MNLNLECEFIQNYEIQTVNFVYSTHHLKEAFCFRAWIYIRIKYWVVEISHNLVWLINGLPK